MQILLWFILALTIAGCGAPLLPASPVPMSSPMPDVPNLDDLRKLGPELRRYLLQQGQEVLRQAQDEALRQAPGKAPTAPEAFAEQLRPIVVVIQARRDITRELESRGGRVRSVTANGVVVITAEVSPAMILGLLTLQELESVELARPVSPANGERSSD